MKNKGEKLVYILGFFVIAVAAILIMPECAEDQALVRGLFWFECVAK